MITIGLGIAILIPSVGCDSLAVDRAIQMLCVTGEGRHTFDSCVS
jgi:hypothetical protein